MDYDKWIRRINELRLVTVPSVYELDIIIEDAAKEGTEGSGIVHVLGIVKEQSKDYSDKYHYDDREQIVDYIGDLLFALSQDLQETKVGI